MSALRVPVESEPANREQENVIGWRLAAFLELDYPIELAEQLAHLPALDTEGHIAADLGRARRLHAAGCDPQIAARILR